MSEIHTTVSEIHTTPKYLILFGTGSCSEPILKNRLIASRKAVAQIFPTFEFRMEGIEVLVNASFDRLNEGMSQEKVLHNIGPRR